MKMKKMIVFFTFVIMLAASMVVFAADKSKDSSQAKVQQQTQTNVAQPLASLQDKAALLNSAQQKALSDKIAQIEKKHNIRVAVLTVKALPEGVSEKKLADDTLNQNYRDEQNNNGSIILVVCPEIRKWYVSTDNNMRKIVTDDEGFPYLRDQFVPLMKEDNYDGAFENYVSTVDFMCSYYKDEGESYNPANEFSIAALILGFLCSLGIGWFFVECLRSNMGNVKPQKEADEYMKRESLQIPVQQDNYLYTNRVVTRRSSNDNDSDSSSSNGGGGGSY